MNKYEKIQKLQTLKENGTITQNEFDIEKAKVLNENNNQNKKNHFGIIILCAIVIILGSGIVVNIIISNNAKKLGSNYESSNEYSNNIDASNKYASKIKNKWEKVLGNNTNNLKCAVYDINKDSLYLQYSYDTFGGICIIDKGDTVERYMSGDTEYSQIYKFINIAKNGDTNYVYMTLSEFQNIIK